MGIRYEKELRILRKINSKTLILYTEKAYQTTSSRYFIYFNFLIDAESSDIEFKEEDV